MIRFIPLLLSAFIFRPAANLSAGEILRMDGYMTLWKQNASTDAFHLPVPVKKNILLKLSLVPPEKPGNAAFKKILRSFDYKNGIIVAEIRFFMLYPHDSPPFCQVQINISGEIKAFCSVSLNRKDFVPFPVFSCAGYDGNERVGFTLHRKKMK